MVQKSCLPSPTFIYYAVVAVLLLGRFEGRNLRLLFGQQHRRDTTNEVSNRTAPGIYQKVNMLALRPISQVPCPIAFRIFQMPSLHHHPVKLINNNLEIAVWTNKHVVGVIEDDLFRIFDHQLDIL